ncbi:nuclear transport factor 2 family protein [Chitinilyticum piscinae]|uniref:Nuclear transport factor 2 family protein n=1 Tax=Chitinilyticum piscinae TaxID=2866724 RepID=A0A8J7G0M0_9NEIS|nr:nuclear transport factor 2 family protein [Chitinilyticum piscinae]MBE9609158.1 nuclear transport factor 2 family protein [Chitinilyticum piscinae]
MSSTYQLILTGNILPGTPPEQAVANLAQLLKLELAQAQALLHKSPTLIKKEIPQQQVDNYLQHFARAGVEVKAEALAAPTLSLQPDAPAIEQITCPKCARVQPKRTLCLDCGCDMPRLLATQNDKPREAAPVSAASVSPIQQGFRATREPLPLGKILFVALLLAAAGWWYFVASRSISEEQAREYYAHYEKAMLTRDPKAMCALLADDFQGSSNIGSIDKKSTCADQEEFFSTIAQLGEKMGGMMQLDSRYEIHSVTLSADKKQATVNLSSELDVGGSIMNIKAQSTDTLIRRNGKVLLWRSEGLVQASSGQH